MLLWLTLFVPAVSLEYTVVEGSAGAFIQVDNDDANVEYTIALNKLTLLKKRADVAKRQQARKGNFVVDDNLIAERITNTLRELSYAVDRRGAKPVLAFGFEPQETPGEAQAEAESWLESPFHSDDSEDLPFLERLEREGQRIMELLRPKEAKPPAEAVANSASLGGQLFERICEKAIDWLGGSFPTNRIDNLLPIDPESDCPRNHFSCVRHIRHAHFTRHFPVGLIHFHWHESLRGVITHIVRDLHCHRAIRYVEVDVPLDLQEYKDEQPGEVDLEWSWWWSSGSQPGNNAGHLKTISNDPMVKKQWGLPSVNASEAWAALYGSRRTPVRVMVIDSGVDMSHPDLVSNFEYISGYGPSVSVLPSDPSGEDDLGHGTHCSGIVAATVNNGIGVAGVTDNKAKIFMCKFLSEGSGQMTDAAKCIDMAVEHKFDIISASWGGPERTNTLSDALQAASDANVLFVVAAGNDGTDLNQNNNFWPACERFPNQITVAATNWTGALANFSNQGDACVDVAAPGTKILSTVPQRAYGYKSGTSMATPLVAGVAALVKAASPKLLAPQIGDILLKARVYDANYEGKVRSRGRVNANQAVAAALGASFFSIQRTLTDYAVQEKAVFEGGTYVQVKPGATVFLPIFPSAAEVTSRSTDTTTTKYHFSAELIGAPAINGKPALDKSFKTQLRVQVRV